MAVVYGDLVANQSQLKIRMISSSGFGYSNLFLIEEKPYMRANSTNLQCDANPHSAAEAKLTSEFIIQKHRHIIILLKHFHPSNRKTDHIDLVIWFTLECLRKFNPTHKTGNFIRVNSFQFSEVIDFQSLENVYK
jgi:hypothetical protein